MTERHFDVRYVPPVDAATAEQAMERVIANADAVGCTCVEVGVFIRFEPNTLLHVTDYHEEDCPAREAPTTVEPILTKPMLN